jgi:GTP pyrophosphokinase
LHKIKNNLPINTDGSIDLEQWLQKFVTTNYQKDLDLLRHACNFTQISIHDYATEVGESCLAHALNMVDILVLLNADRETLIAAMMFVNMHYAELSLDDITEQFGANISKLVEGVWTMSATSLLNRTEYGAHHHHQVGNIRKMLLAMVDDVRVVLIKLADKLSTLRFVAYASHEMRKSIAAEAMELYAPLANCLGIGSIKWELEDLSFRYLEPEKYKEIAKSLNSKRSDRERYVNLVIDELQIYLSAMGLKHYSVYGRAKHIHSIYRKMLRKKVSLSQVYDATAVRILVDTEAQCYEVLSAVNTLWEQVPQEFDDYIAHPKPNGYQSLHSAVIGPENRCFEIQIRTFAMHDQAEQGVAAHWKYKSTDLSHRAGHERKIAWLREVLAWHHDVSGGDKLSSTFIDDRVYVFTPNSDIIDLPNGVTALDFAYHVHSDLGHRCRGAKVNGSIIPLTYVLKTGDLVEILTGKEAKPSRDWINPHLNYLKSSRARAKVLHWFKMQDYEKNCIDGKELLEKELKSLNFKFDQLHNILPILHFKTLDDLYAAIGRGDVKLQYVLNKLIPQEKSELKATNIIKRATKQINISQGDLTIAGVGQLLTHMAKCCQPLPGDPVIGYITLGRGVSIHKQSCSNILHANDKQRERLVVVDWAQEVSNFYVTELAIKAFDRTSLLRDVTAVLASDKAKVLSLNTNLDPQNNINYITLRLELSGLEHCTRIMNHLRNIANVLDVQRHFG